MYNYEIYYDHSLRLWTAIKFKDGWLFGYTGYGPTKEDAKIDWEYQNNLHGEQE